MSKEHDLTRRGFLKATALAGAAAAFGVSATNTMQTTEKAHADSSSETKIIKSVCHGCIASCPCLVHVRNGVAVQIEGDPDACESRGSLCMKGMNQIQTMYSPRRILHPIKRAGARGENKWEVISWDDAMDLASDKFIEAREKYGPYSFFATGGGGGSYTNVNVMCMPAAVGAPNGFEPGAAQCLMPRESMAAYVGGICQSMADNYVTEPFNLANVNTTSLVLWGTQPSVSQVAQSGRGMAELRASGCKTVVIDPNFSPDAQKATVWLPVRAGTDTTLVMGWFRYIFENELYDEEFCKYWTNLPFILNPDTQLPYYATDIWPDYQTTTPDDTPDYVCLDNRTGEIKPFAYSLPEDSDVDPEIFATVEINGVTCKSAGQVYREAAEPYTLEKVAETCWLKPEKIEEAIHVYTDAETSGITLGVATDQQPDSSEMALGCLGLDFVMGYYEKPGTTQAQPLLTFGPMGAGTSIPTKRPTQSFNGLFTDHNLGYVIGASEQANAERIAACDQESLQKSFQIVKDRLGVTQFKGECFWNQAHNPTLCETIKTGEPYQPRIWYEFSGNKLACTANAADWYDAIQHVDFIMCQYPMLTSFHIEAADLVFPTKKWLEMCGTTMQLNQTFMRTPITHIGETADTNYPSVKLLETVTEKTGEDFSAYTQTCAALPMEAQKESVVKAFGASDWDDLVNNQDKYVPIEIAPADEYYAYEQYKTIVNDGLPAGFATESRKAEPYATILLKMSRTGFPYVYPFELDPCDDYSPICKEVHPNEEPDDEYPLVLTSGRLPYFHHTTMRHSAFARELFPTAEIRINPEDAQARGIEHLDWVKITSRRGSIRARAYITKGVQPGQTWMERFYNPECYDETQENPTAGWREENVNVITNNQAPYNEVNGSYTNRGFTVQVEKSERPDNVWVEPEEFRPFMPTLQNEPVTEELY
jgi:anaerobic selenocysteine-containing dehydrogenase